MKRACFLTDEDWRAIRDNLVDYAGDLSMWAESHLDDAKFEGDEGLLEEAEREQADADAAWDVANRLVDALRENGLDTEVGP